MLRDHQRTRGAQTDRPIAQPRPTAEGSRHVPAAVRREVWKRDGERCAHIGIDGRVCGSTHLVQFHHVVPFASGGAATAANISLRCFAHNQAAAVEDFGADVVERGRQLSLV